MHTMKALAAIITGGRLQGVITFSPPWPRGGGEGHLQSALAFSQRAKRVPQSRPAKKPTPNTTPAVCVCVCGRGDAKSQTPPLPCVRVRAQYRSANLRGQIHTLCIHIYTYKVYTFTYTVYIDSTTVCMYTAGPCMYVCTRTVCIHTP